MQGVFSPLRSIWQILTFRRKYAILKKSSYSAKEVAMNQNNRALKEAFVWGVVIVLEIIIFLTYFRFGEWFKATLPAVLVSNAAILFRVLICLFRYKEKPLPWERSTTKDYTALIEAVICTALLIGAPFWIKTLPQDAGYGDLILALPTLAACTGLMVRGIICFITFVNSTRK